jgi:hypothetical protein
VLPLIKIEGFKNIVPEKYILNLPILELNSDMVILNEVVIGAEVSKPFWTIENIFFVGATISVSFFILKLARVFKLIFNNPKQKSNNVLFITLLNSTAAFSFFNYIFLGEHLQNEDKTSIISHEMVHVQEKHTLDLLYFEVLRIVFWFNPLVYMYQNRISDLHEFIADSKAVKQNKKQYYQNLLSQVFDTKTVSFINPFFKQSLIKKRIIMLQKTKSKQTQLLKYALLIPVVFGMLFYSSCSQEAAAQEYNISNESQEKASSEVLQSIADLKESIAANGHMTDEEKNALKTLMMLVSPDGLEEPFFKDVVKYAEIPYGVIEQVPTFPGCEKVQTREESINCMSKELNAFVFKNFNTDLSKKKNLTGEQKISVLFKIDAEGNIVDVKARAPHPELQAEAIRVVNLLPKMIPGEQDGVKVTVPYYLPIKFKVNE